MSSDYTGWRARYYNRNWRTFTKRTLSETLAMIDMEALHQVNARLSRAPRVLDVACGTGILLKQIAERFPEADLYGVDASSDMLAQAQAALDGLAHVRLVQAEVGSGETANLPFPPQIFDLITCTNVLHDFSQPVEVLAGLKWLLSPEGQLVVEDYAQREHNIAFAVVEWLARHLERGHMRAYTLSEAKSLCRQANLHVLCGKSFTVNWLWHGWVLHLSGDDGC